MSLFTRRDATVGGSIHGSDSIPVDQNDLMQEENHHSPVLQKESRARHPLLVTQAQRISALEDQVMGCTKLIEGLQEQLSKLTVATPASLAGTLGASSIDVPSTMRKASVELSASAPVGRFSLDAACKPASKSGRVQDARRRDLLNILRMAMNDVMGMKKDKDIASIELASAQEVEEYDIERDDALVQPTLDPMRPYLPKPSSTWNKKLWRLLAANIAKRYDFDDPTWREMEKAFYERLKRLNSLLKTERLAVNTSTTSDRVLRGHT